MCVMYIELYLTTEPGFEEAWRAGYVLLGWPGLVTLINILYIVDEALTGKRLARDRVFLDKLVKKLESKVDELEN